MNEPVPPVDVETLVSGADAEHKSELRLWLRLLSTGSLISGEIRRRLRRAFNVTLPQFDLLAQVAREPEGLRLSELSRRMMVTNGNVTGLVDKLADQGFLVRDPSTQDRRVINVRLTKAGLALFSVMAKAHEDWLAEIMSDVPPDVRDALMCHLGRLKASALRYGAG